MSTHDAYLATMLRRWHVNPHLNESGQTLGHHGAAAAILAHALWPRDAEVLWACIAHDLGESVTGDVPSPAKLANPELALMLVSISARSGFSSLAGDGTSPVTLSPRSCAMQAHSTSASPGHSACARIAAAAPWWPNVWPDWLRCGFTCQRRNIVAR